jgi:hypothetical protein
MNKMRQILLLQRAASRQMDRFKNEGATSNKEGWKTKCRLATEKGFYFYAQ